MEDTVQGADQPLVIQLRCRLNFQKSWTENSFWLKPYGWFQLELRNTISGHSCQTVKELLPAFLSLWSLLLSFQWKQAWWCQRNCAGSAQQTKLMVVWVLPGGHHLWGFSMARHGLAKARKQTMQSSGDLKLLLVGAVVFQQLCFRRKGSVLDTVQEDDWLYCSSTCQDWEWAFLSTQLATLPLNSVFFL